jgi:hypothetical protein
VEGQTEEAFVKELLRPYFAVHCLEVHPIKILTAKHHGKPFKGGFVNYEHLRRDALRYLKQEQTAIVSTLVDFFRLPSNFPSYENCMKKLTTVEKIECLERALHEDIGYFQRFIPYIQQHEFEALLFASNQGFERYFPDIALETQAIIQKYPNPEDINHHPDTAPSKRLSKIIAEYDKVLFGNTLALEIGLSQIIAQCPRFRAWTERIISSAQQ